MSPLGFRLGPRGTWELDVADFDITFYAPTAARLRWAVSLTYLFLGSGEP